jgi:nitroimidazol reductase NimA-like FMN-containing flavoprotein (pyridoxamine 5'-phosphate oxidase superfamily)
MQDLSAEEIRELLQTVQDGVLAFTNGDQPYCLPFGFVCIDGIVYLSMFPRGRKWHYLQSHPQVCFTAYRWSDNRTEWFSAVIDGTLEQVNDEKEIESVIRANMQKQNIPDASYLQKRMKYYKKSLSNPSALKIVKLLPSSITGKKMYRHI